MNIIFSSDNNYAPYLAVSLFSILKNNEKEKIVFYILDFGISNENKKLISDLIKLYDKDVLFISIDEKIFSSFPKTIDYISLATYARLNITDYIKDIEKAIYIDVDTLTNGSLQELWNVNIDDYYIAACPDLFINEEKSSYKEVIGLENENYFNAGVLVINLKKWRMDNILTKSIAWLENYKDVIQYQDQDILNGIFKGEVKFINTRYNFSPSEKKLIKKGFKAKAKMPIVIYHYCGETKFWHRHCWHSGVSFVTILLKEMSNIITVPSEWINSFEKNTIFSKIKRLRKEFNDRFIYKIF